MEDSRQAVAADTDAAGTPSEKGAAVVTGGTRGIGYELARLFAGTGHDVVLVARTESDLRETAEDLTDRFGVRAVPLVADLTDPDAPERIHEAVSDADLDVTALVNNAGFGNAGPFAETAVEADLGIVDVKVRAATHLAKLFIDDLLAGPSAGQLLTVSSAAAFVPGPKSSVYYAANAYGRSFSESLAAEYHDDDLTVTCLCPGPVDTDFHERANTESRTETLVPTPTLDARSVARAGFRGLQRGQTLVVPGLTMRAVVAVAGLLPDAVLRRIMRYYNRTL